ncbi:MAG: hypothetical protein ACYTG0_22695 [Planctomycetota bacterium]
MEAVREAYRSVGLGWLVAPTRLPLLRHLSGCIYGLFARYRVPLGRLLVGDCAGGSCAVAPPNDRSSTRTLTDKRPPTSLVCSMVRRSRHSVFRSSMRGRSGAS